jgi:hypothetical protein
MKRKVITVAAVLGVCLGVVVTRAVWEGRGALDRGSDFARAGDLPEAVTWYRRAARWYVPLAPHVGRAYDHLEAIARDAEAAGDVDLALAAWRGVRGSIKATRSFYVPHVDRLEPANQRIAALMAQQEVSARRDAAVSEDVQRAAAQAFHYALLARDESPSVLWSVVALLGLAGWLGGGALFAARGVTADDKLVPRTAARAGALVAAGLVVWMLGLYLA